MVRKVGYTIVRILLGLAWIFFGVTKFMPMESPMLPQPAMDFLMAMGVTGYMIPAVGIIETLVGLMLLFNMWVPLAMILLAPVMVNVILFNVFLAPSTPGTIMLLVLTAMQVYIMYLCWTAYKPLLVRKFR